MDVVGEHLNTKLEASPSVLGSMPGPAPPSATLVGHLGARMTQKRTIYSIPPQSRNLTCWGHSFSLP